MNIYSYIGEFFGFEDNTRPVEGYLSWQHLLMVTLFIGAAVGLAVYFGIRNRNKDDKAKNKVLITAAILIDLFELSKYIVICSRSHTIKAMYGMLPLFLCSMQIIAIPLAAFTKGFVKRAACNFVFIFGILGALTGTYLAANYYNNQPVINFDTINSTITHSISGFAGLYIAVVGYVKIDRKSVGVCAIILLCFELLSLTANHFLEPTSYESNYMFLSNSAGTPFEIVNTIVGGHQILYTIGVGSLYFIYMFLFILIYSLCTRKKETKNEKI